MNQIRKPRRALQLGLAFGLAAAFAFASGCAAVQGESADPDGDTGEAQQAFLLECTNSGGTTPGALSVTPVAPGQAYCYRLSAIVSGEMPPPPPNPLPSCWKLAKMYGCIGFGGEY